MGNAVPTFDTIDTGAQYYGKKKEKEKHINKYKKSNYLS